MRSTSKAVVGTAVKFDVRFSITAKQNKQVKAAIDAIPEADWSPIPYWLRPRRKSRPPTSPRPRTCCSPPPPTPGEVRLVVRRTRPTPGSQLALLVDWDYHAFVTDRDLPNWPRSKPTTGATPSSNKPSPS